MTIVGMVSWNVSFMYMNILAWCFFNYSILIIPLWRVSVVESAHIWWDIDGHSKAYKSVSRSFFIFSPTCREFPTAANHFFKYISTNPFSFSILYLNNHFLSSNFPSLQSASQFHPTNHINTNTKTPTTNQSGHPLAPQPTETPKPTKSTPTNTQNSTTPMQKLQQQINWPPTNTTTTHRNTQTSKINTYKHPKPINM